MSNSFVLLEKGSDGVAQLIINRPEVHNAFDDDVIEHHVEVALVPDLVGTTLRRHAALDGEVLRLSYALTARSGVERKYSLVFNRG